MNYKKLFPQMIGSILIMLLFTACGASQPAPASTPATPTYTPVPPTAQPAQAIILGTEVRTLHSSIVDQDYAIQVALPQSYSTSDKTYPVVYTTLGDFRFGLTTDTVRELRLDQELRSKGHMPEVIVVGIAYDGLKWQYYFEYPTLVFRDLTPTASGEADKFLEFLQDELFPFIDANYRTDTQDRTIVGHSVGGLFSLYVLFQSPDTFNRYIALSPSLWWDKKVIFEYEEEFAKNQSELPVKLFLAAGELETSLASDLEKFHQILEDRNYAGLEMEMVIFEDETHSSVLPGATSRGFRSVFP
jgi:predicted alpha/beta superfamily hydrolase